MPKNFFKLGYIFLFLLIIVGFLVRCTGFFTNNVLFLFDNAMDLLLVKRLVIDHKILLVGPQSAALAGHFHGALWSYFLAIPFLLGRGNPAFFTLFMAICSTLSIILTFFLVKKIVNIQAALLASTFYAFANFSVDTSRFIWNPYPIIWLIPVYVFFVWLFVIKNKYVLYALSFLTSLIFHLEAIYGVTLLPLLFIFGLIDLNRHKKWKEKILRLGVTFFAFVIILVPTFIFDFRHQFIISSSLLKTFQQGGTNLTHEKADLEKPFSQRLVLRSQDLYKQTIQSITPNQGLNWLIFLIALLAFYQAVKRKDKQIINFAILCLIAMLSTWGIFLTLKYAVWDYYWIGIPPIYALLAACLIGYLVKVVNYKFTYVYFLGLILLLLVYSPWTKTQYWYKGDLNPGSGNLTTQLEVVKKVYADAKEQPFSVYVLTPPVYDYIYRYLFWWKGYTVYHHFPLDTKQNLVYLIMEQSKTDPQGIFFQQQVVKTSAKTVETFSFPDSIVVKKIITSPNESSVDPNYFPPSAGL